MFDSLSEGFWKLAAAATTVVATSLGWLNRRIFSRIDNLDQRVTDLEKHYPSREEIKANHQHVMDELYHIQERIDRLSDRT